MGTEGSTIEEIEKRLIDAKRKIAELWEVKGCTDDEVLEAADEVDRLLNSYETMRKDQRYILFP